MSWLLAASIALAAASPADPPSAAPVIELHEQASADPLLAEAFRAAFPDGSALPRDDRVYDVAPLATVDLGGGRIALLSTGILRDASHADDGLNAVHYLERRGGRLHVLGSWFGLGAGGSHGAAATRWGVTRALSEWPMLYTEGGGTWQGCSVGFAVLTELRAEGPADVADFQVFYSDAGTGSATPPREFHGTIVRVEPGRAFTIRYQGRETFEETWVRDGDRYRLAGGESMVPGC